MADTDLLDDFETPGLETPELETPETPAPETPAPDTPEGETPPPPPITSLFQADGKKLDPAIKTALGKLKEENPDAAKLLAKAAYRVAELDREFPGGLTEARELRDKVEGFGGLSSIEERIEGAKEFESLAAAFDKADPAFVEDMVVSNREAFAALCPVVFDKYAEVHPEGWQHYLGQVVYGDIQRNDIPAAMTRMSDALKRKDFDVAAEAFNQVASYLARFRDLASKQVAAPKPSERKASGGDDLTKREEAVRSKEWNVERGSLYRRIVEEEYRRSIGDRKPAGEEKAQIRELFISRATALSNKYFPGWQAKSEEFIRKNDKAGYMRYVTSIYRRVVPEATASAVRSTLKGAAPKPALATAGQPANGKPAASTARPAAAEPGFKPVAKEPGSWDIDYDRSSSKMIREGRAYLNDGSKVSWKV